MTFQIYLDGQSASSPLPCPWHYSRVHKSMDAINKILSFAISTKILCSLYAKEYRLMDKLIFFWVRSTYHKEKNSV